MCGDVAAAEDENVTSALVAWILAVTSRYVKVETQKAMQKVLLLPNAISTHIRNIKRNRTPDAQKSPQNNPQP